MIGGPRRTGCDPPPWFTFAPDGLGNDSLSELIRMGTRLLKTHTFWVNFWGMGFEGVDCIVFRIEWNEYM